MTKGDRIEGSAVSKQASSEIDYEILIVGAGFAGLRMLHEARNLGMSAHILEMGDGVGGTWFWNRYPGARCDVLSADYSYTFSPELDQEWRWSERYATQPEILSYIDHVVEKFDFGRDISLNTRVESAHFVEDQSIWSVTDEHGRQWRARYLVMATGCLSVPKMPDFPGQNSFLGESYHTAFWPKEKVDFTGKRVAVIGTGSSGTQLIPIAAREAAHLTVFQRTPNFSIPARNAPISDEQDAEIKAEYPARRLRARNSPTGLGYVPIKEKALEVDPETRRAHYEQQWNTVGFGFLLSFPDLMLDRAANDTAADFVREKIRGIVEDEKLADMLSPTGYPFGAKRPCVDSGYFETFNRDDVELVDMRVTPIERITETGLATTDAEYEFDMIVYATGFDAITGALLKPDIRGADGVSLRESWADGPAAFLGLATAGFPNFFFITGPGSPSVLSNVLMSIEQHVEWLGRMFKDARSRNVTYIEATEEAQSEWTNQVAETAARTLYPQAASYYMGDDVQGKPRGFMPYAGGLRAFRRKCDEVAENGYAGMTLKETATASGV